jgi:hypothetical protein
VEVGLRSGYYVYYETTKRELGFAPFDCCKRAAEDMHEAYGFAVRFHQNVKKQSDRQNAKKQSGAKGSQLSSRRMRNVQIDWMSNQKVMQKRNPRRFKVLCVGYDSGAEECKERRGALALEDRVWIGNQKAGWLCPAVQSEAEATDIGAQEAEQIRRANKLSHIQTDLSEFRITPSLIPLFHVVSPKDVRQNPPKFCCLGIFAHVSMSASRQDEIERYLFLGVLGLGRFLMFLLLD